jgi:hypothetical protein
MMMVIYLASLTRSVLALHKLIDNKEQHMWQEKAKIKAKEESKVSQPLLCVTPSVHVCFAWVRETASKPCCLSPLQKAISFTTIRHPFMFMVPVSDADTAFIVFWGNTS